MVPDYPDPPPFVLPERPPVTGQPPRTEAERWEAQQYLGSKKMGGGFVSPALRWLSSPKQLQDDLGCK